MLTVGIHAKSLTADTPTGVDVYLASLIKSWSAPPFCERVRFRVYAPPNAFKRHDFFKNNSILATAIVGQGRLWTQIRLPLKLWQEKAQRTIRPPFVLFIPAHVMPFFNPSINSIVTIHDLAFLRFPELYPFRERLYLKWTTAFAAERALRIIVPSRATARDLQSFFPAVQRKTTIIPHGVPSRTVSGREQSSRSLRVKNLFLKPGEYFIFLGELRSKKNVARVVQAFDLAVRKGVFKETFKLVLAGRLGFGAPQIMREIDNSSVRNLIHLIGHVGEQEKETLLANARALVFPSIHEGFGLPIIEAQQLGTPVITSLTGSMPEVAGGHLKSAFLVDPFSVGKISRAMAEIYRNARLRSRLIQGGKKNIRRFDWQKSAQTTLSVLEEAVKEKD